MGFCIAFVRLFNCSRVIENRDLWLQLKTVYGGIISGGIGS